MSKFKETTLILDKKFDSKSCRHFLNDQLTVMHCHHYSTLYTQLAIDSEETELLKSVAEESFYKALTDYLSKHDICDLESRIDIACQYYAAVGLGKMRVVYLGTESGKVELLASHLDKGWMKKWGKSDQPVNYIGTGYISGMFAAILDCPLGTYKTREMQSIAMGAETSIFNVTK